MLKETKNFVKEHKYEIIIGTGFVIVGAALIYCKVDLLYIQKEINKVKKH